MERMKRLTESDEMSEMTLEEHVKQFEKVECQSAESKLNLDFSLGMYIAINKIFEQGINHLVSLIIFYSRVTR